jgi:hypothetical protein
VATPDQPAWLGRGPRTGDGHVVTGHGVTRGSCRRHRR